MTTCLFCQRLASGDVTDANAHLVAFADGYPVAAGHTLVVPRRLYQPIAVSRRRSRYCGERGRWRSQRARSRSGPVSSSSLPRRSTRRVPRCRRFPTASGAGSSRKRTVAPVSGRDRRVYRVVRVHTVCAAPSNSRALRCEKTASGRAAAATRNGSGRNRLAGRRHVPCSDTSCQVRFWLTVV